MHRVFPPTNNQHNLVDLSHPNNNKKIPLSSQDLKNMWFRNLHESVRYHSLKSSPQKFRKYGAWKTGTKWPIFRCFFAVRMFVSGTGSYQLKRVSVGEETLTWPFSWTQVCVFFFLFFRFFRLNKSWKKNKRYQTWDPKSVFASHLYLQNHYVFKMNKQPENAPKKRWPFEKS